MGSGVPSPLWLPKKFQCIFWNLTALRSASCWSWARCPLPSPSAGAPCHIPKSPLKCDGRLSAMLLSNVLKQGWKDFFEKQDARAISTGQLHPSQGFHLQPIDEVVYLGPSGLASGRTYLKAGFPLRCFQRLSLPHIATLLCRWHDNRSTSGVSIPVLSY